MYCVCVCVSVCVCLCACVCICKWVSGCTVHMYVLLHVFFSHTMLHSVCLLLCTFVLLC